MANPGITLVKTFVYRGDDEEWSNRYHFASGGGPYTPTTWRALVDDLIDMEKTLYWNEVSVIRAYCYDDTDDPSVYTYELADFGGVVPGTLTIGSGDRIAPGDDAAFISWDTGVNNTKGKPIYLRKYWHAAVMESGSADNVSTEWQAAAATFADDVVTAAGAWPGMTGPSGVVPVSNRVSPYITTRTLKRRGRRPTSP